ncbi:MAG TPA: NAD(+)/NADH kinase [Candidatus Cloacimonadota bacterium]|nr:NAD(+)/NADH kinase [Candidatus Cloacimonadota bacterium]
MKHIALVFRPNIDSESIFKTLSDHFTNHCRFYLINPDDENQICKISKKNADSIGLTLQADCSENGLIDGETALFKKKPDCILVFGGDGTILRSLHYASNFHAPILGFNMGTLGFLTDCKINELIPSINMFINGKYQIEKRMLLDISVIRNNERIIHLPALNDAVIYKGELSKLITLKLFSNKRYVYETRCDGIITATPTGSTAYSMSSGGPIISPDMEAFVVNPLNPHVLSIRPMIFNAEDTLHFKLEEPHSSTVLQIDGVNVVQLLPKDKITIKRSTKKMCFIKLSHRTFYQILRKKLKMGKL